MIVQEYVYFGLYGQQKDHSGCSVVAESRHESSGPGPGASRQCDGRAIIFIRNHNLYDKDPLIGGRNPTETNGFAVKTLNKPAKSSQKSPNTNRAVSFQALLSGMWKWDPTECRGVPLVGARCHFERMLRVNSKNSRNRMIPVGSQDIFFLIY